MTQLAVMNRTVFHFENSGFSIGGKCIRNTNPAGPTNKYADRRYAFDELSTG
jgi:hypothetical protein